MKKGGQAARNEQEVFYNANRGMDQITKNKSTSMDVRWTKLDL